MKLRLEAEEYGFDRGDMSAAAEHSVGCVSKSFSVHECGVWLFAGPEALLSIRGLVCSDCTGVLGLSSMEKFRRFLLSASASDSSSFCGRFLLLSRRLISTQQDAIMGQEKQSHKQGHWWRSQLTHLLAVSSLKMHRTCQLSNWFPSFTSGTLTFFLLQATQAARARSGGGLNSAIAQYQMKV